MKPIKSIVILATSIALISCSDEAPDESVASGDAVCIYADVPFPLGAENIVSEEPRKIVQKCTLHEGRPYWETANAEPA